MLILILVLIGQQTCHLTKFKVTAGTHWILRTVDTHTAGSATTAIGASVCSHLVVIEVQNR